MNKGIRFYKNIFNSKRRNGDVFKNAADPFIFKFNGAYYLICTKEKGLVLFKSIDLIKWNYINDDNGIVAYDEYLKYAFAPEIMYDNGYFYIVSSPSGNGHRIYRSKKIEGPYEAYEDNIQELIDGSFFKDSSEHNYFLRASESGITIKRLKEDNRESDFTLFDEYYNFANTSIGNWTEGPFMLKRYGYYYLTYTGTHFLSNAYRVDYSSGKSLSKNALDFKDTLLISTSNNFYGLGHSMTFLGPNLDSYYIAYHNMMPNGERYLNISRLMFDNHGHMLVNGISENNNVLFDRPYFEKRINEENYLSDEIFDNKHFSIEYNFIGRNVKLFVSYQDKENNQYIMLKDDSIELIENKKGIENTVIKYQLRKKYNLDVIHSIRLQYANKLLTLYLDDMELILKEKVLLKKGKIGFENNKLIDSYLAYSLFAYGTSDNECLKKDSFFLVNSIHNKQKYSLSFYIDEENEYNFYIKCKKEGNIKLLIDKEVVECKLNKGNNYICSCYLKKGKHKFVLEGIKATTEVIKIRKKDYPLLVNDKNYLERVNIYHRYLTLPTGLYLENDRNALITKDEYRLYEIKANLKLVGLPTDDDRFVGLVSDVNNYGKTNEFENAYSFMGWMFVMNSKSIKIIKTNYMHSEVLYKMKKPSKDTFDLKIRKDEESISFYLDNQLIYKTSDNYFFLQGSLGIYNNHASGLFKDIEIINLEEDK